MIVCDQRNSLTLQNNTFFPLCRFQFFTCNSDETLEALSDAQYVAPAAKTVDLHSANHRNSFLYVFDYQTKFGDFPQVGFLEVNFIRFIKKYLHKDFEVALTSEITATRPLRIFISFFLSVVDVRNRDEKIYLNAHLNVIKK